MLLTVFTVVCYLGTVVCSQKTCRCMPWDACWPSSSAWSELNTTVEGRLIATVPLASVCHDPSHDEDACAALQEDWPFAQTHIFDSASVVSPLAQNQSCDPFTPQESQCRLGNYPVYAVNASSADHAAAALEFARSNNLRLIIKSTGHDLLGRSSGAGSLSIWMHAFQGLTITDNYNSSSSSSGANNNNHSDYRGPAMRIEPGVLAHQVLEATREKGLRPLVGTCPTVGVAGGYTSGGGHSLLGSTYGLSADNVLEWDVLTVSGERVTATPVQHADLYWALTGGGTGWIAVILSVTVKAFPDGEVSGAGVTFNITASPSEDVFWSGVQALHHSIPAWLDQNATAAYVLSGGTFSVQPLALPDQPEEAMMDLIQPFLDQLSTLEIPYTLDVTSYPNFIDLYEAYYGPLPYGVIPSTVTQVSRLIPRSLLDSASGIDALVAAQQYIASLEGGVYWIVGTVLSVPSTPSVSPTNSVLPAWRHAAIHQMITQQWDWQEPWQTNLQRQETLLDDVLPSLREITPGSGTYMNEGNRYQEDWKEAFYGDNYDRLREVKAEWDPESFLYAHAGVGSDEWVLDSEGRLCSA